MVAADGTRAGRGLDVLRTPAEFQRVLKDGRRLDGPLFLLVICIRPTGSLRLGLAVGRRVGGAVVRNRARRRLREVFRHRVRVGGERPFDVVVVGKPGLGGASFGELQSELERRFARQERLGRRPGPGPGPGN